MAKAKKPVELPKHKCSLEVNALEIKEVKIEHKSVRLVPEDKKQAAVNVSMHFANQYKPHAGGYYVVESNGNRSFQSAKEFNAHFKAVKAE